MALKFCGTDLFELETIKFNKSGFVEIVRMIYLKTIMAFDQNGLFLGNQKKNHKSDHFACKYEYGIHSYVSQQYLDIGSLTLVQNFPLNKQKIRILYNLRYLFHICIIQTNAAL